MKPKSTRKVGDTKKLKDLQAKANPRGGRYNQAETLASSIQKKEADSAAAQVNKVG